MRWLLLLSCCIAPVGAVRATTPFRARRSVVGLGLAAALHFHVAPACAQRSKMVQRSSKEAAAAARAFKFSEPGVETEAFKAAERRRADVLAGVTPRDADRTPIRDPVTGKEIGGRTYQEALAAGDDSCARPPFCRK
eukprot:CAMPEP_0119380570 /NCGR_PEP_ID=MMETSP1334-20130426/57580_1 /TAXON_ID=127549 /ORGANISM="Calcidiscus leptoporus, Strain RCC1130" /LENGTH=136 /DNA_ID=CAMNT_0007400457 /DNA_START=53 /DNA_END=463 /DNA_ORIENTATION=+